jgi:hypothetical protein
VDQTIEVVGDKISVRTVGTGCNRRVNPATTLRMDYVYNGILGAINALAGPLVFTNENQELAGELTCSSPILPPDFYFPF